MKYNGRITKVGAIKSSVLGQETWNTGNAVCGEGGRKAGTMVIVTQFRHAPPGGVSSAPGKKVRPVTVQQYERT